MSIELIEGMVVEREGEGEVLLCIHGLGGSSNTWTPLLSSVSGWSVVRPDLPGSARSSLPTQAVTIELYVETLEKLLAALGIRELRVMAHSMGTIVAQHLAVRLPQVVKSLLLFGPLVSPAAAAKPNLLARAALARTGLSGMQQIADAVVAASTSDRTKAEQPTVLALIRESIMRQSPEGYAQSCEALANAVATDLSKITVPTLLFSGDQDTTAPPANVQKMAEQLRASHLVLAQGCGHWPTFEQPFRCIEAVKSFLHTSS